MLRQLAMGTGIVLLSFAAAVAGPPDPPTLVYSTSVNDQPVTRSSFADLRNGSSFTGAYRDPNLPELVELAGAGVFYYDEPRSLSEGFSGPMAESRVEMSAAPAAFHAQIFNRASSTGGQHGFVNTSAGVARWFVLRGARAPVNLRADIAFQGTLYANAVAPGDRAAAFFTHHVNVVAYPSDLVADYPVMTNGAVQEPGVPCGPFGAHGTVPDQCWVGDGTQHAVNRVIRSNPFVVLPDVPFRLTLTLNAAASSAGPGANEAWADFRDPGLGTSVSFPGVAGLTPEGIVVDLDGNPATSDVASFADLGYSLRPMPDPATFFLLRERSSNRSTLGATLVSRRGEFGAPVGGNLSGSITISGLDLATVTTGPWAGKGFFSADWQADLEGVAHRGTVRGFAHEVASERRIALEGVVSGGVNGIAQGSLVESAPGSGLYDSLELTWGLSEVDGTLASGVIAMTGPVAWGAPRSSSSTLEVLQLSAEGTTSGESEGVAGMVMTVVRVVGQGRPQAGRGFAVVSYEAPGGPGEAWAFAQVALPGVTELGGMGTGPLEGAWHLALDETASERVVTGFQQRSDLGLPPMADVAVSAWTSNGASPGSTLTYAIHYENRGLRVAEDVVVLDRLSPLMDYLGSSAGGVYDPDSHEVTFQLGTLPPGRRGTLYVSARVLWALSATEVFRNQVLIGTRSGERHATVAPGDTVLTPEWLSLQVARADDDNDWDVRNPPPGYDPNDYYWRGMGPDSIKNRVRQALQLIKEYKPEWYEYLNSLYDKGAIHADGDLDSSEWNGAPGVRHLYLDGQDVKLGYTDAQWAEWTESPTVFTWLVDLAGKMIHEARHSDGQWYPGSEKGEMEAFSAEGAFHLAVMDQLLKEGRGDFARALGGHMDTRWQDLEDRDSGWTDAKALASATLSDLLYIDVCIADGDYEAARKRIKELSTTLYWVTDRRESEVVNNAAQTDTPTWTAWDPNAKYGPEGPVAAGQALDYRVEYENVGRGTAFGAYVTDELPAALDEATLVIGPVRSTRDGTIVAPPGTYDQATRTITWLVGEVGPGVGGYAELSAHVRSDAPDGTEIINSATIYFPSVPQAMRTNPIASTVTPPGSTPALAVGPARLWLGLKNSDDQGTNFDVRAELYAADRLIAAGETLCITGLTRNPAKARAALVPLVSDEVETVGPGTVMTLRVLTRIGTTPDGRRCGAPASHPSALGLRLYYDAAPRASQVGLRIGPAAAWELFLRRAGGVDVLGASRPAALTPSSAVSGAVRAAGGNPWSAVGSWTYVSP